ncbi:hypothetical protein K2173_026290 [Erythroxylum novogranatense]|uniref:Uncharacterized protein n=1 Tax=Erythroxylum novogranatense TaxID=1862640 RepID=A0AAV8SCA0_9ROSI|nr:hypothetical protein K2173_026290 [Erythroxylum novogranatense]
MVGHAAPGCPQCPQATPKRPQLGNGAAVVTPRTRPTAAASEKKTTGKNHNGYGPWLQAVEERIQQMEGVKTPEALPRIEEGFVQHLNDPPNLDAGSGGMDDQRHRQPEQEITLQQKGDGNTVKHMGGTISTPL